MEASNRRSGPDEADEEAWIEPITPSTLFARVRPGWCSSWPTSWCHSMMPQCQS